MSHPDALDLVNFGMLLVIWLVQLVIYPGFAHYPPERLVAWHARYTRLISLFVVPLMLAQLGLLAWGAYGGAGWPVHAMLACVLLAWGVTFKFSVALHGRIARDEDPAGAVRLLVRTNWPRTALWSATFVLGWFGR